MKHLLQHPARPLRPGETRSLRVAYHGDLIGHGSLMEGYLQQIMEGVPPQWVEAFKRELPSALDQWLFLRSSERWYPVHANPTYGSGQAVNMDLTLHTPTKYRVASVGRLVESRVEGDVQTTRWVAEQPLEWASFNIGGFEESQIRDPRIPPVTVQVNAEAHAHVRQLFLGARDPEQYVGADVANSLAFFARVFGPPPFHECYATEIPYLHGQSFPGLIHLSWATFAMQSFDQSGFSEVFRAHEIAHQWWGNAVEPASYRDAWLSEGFAEFSGLWYMQVILRDNDKFFKFLRDRRDKIRSRRGDVVPIGLGTRAGELEHDDYQLVVYEKGAWVLQMLRNMMLDFKTMDETAFTAMMTDFYQQYRGHRASTRDFQHVVERHTGFPMGWFFNEWINGTAIPTYSLSWHADPTPDHKYRLQLRVRQEDVPSDFAMPVPLRIGFGDGSEAYVRVNVRGPVTEGQLMLPAQPTVLELNPLESVLAQVKDEGWD